MGNLHYLDDPAVRHEYPFSGAAARNSDLHNAGNHDQNHAKGKSS